MTTAEFTSPFINLEDLSCKWYWNEDSLHAQMVYLSFMAAISHKKLQNNSFNPINILKHMNMDVLPPIEYSLDCIYTDDKQ